MPQHALDPVLLRRIDDVGLSERTVECLREARVMHLGDLVRKTEIELLYGPHVGRGTLREIKTRLAAMGLHLGTWLPDRPPESLGR